MDSSSRLYYKQQPQPRNNQRKIKMETSQYVISIMAIILVIAGIYYYKKKNDSGDNNDGGSSGDDDINDKVNGSHASFLMINTVGAPHPRAMNYLSNQFNSGQRDQFRKIMKANGDNTMYCYLADQGDGPVVNPYMEGFGGSWAKTLNMPKINLWKQLMRQAKGEGLNTIAWLFADDSPELSNTTLAQKFNYINDMITHFEDEVVGWVIALEADEHINPRHYKEMVKLLKSKSKHPVGTHLVPKGENRPGHVDYLTGVDYYFAQVGFAKETYGHSEERHIQYVGEETRRIVSQVGQFGIGIIMAEYNLNSTSGYAKAQGQIAMKNGAKGTGNGW